LAVQFQGAKSSLHLGLVEQLLEAYWLRQLLELSVEVDGDQSDGIL
jgi:hypothetical protein